GPGALETDGHGAARRNVAVVAGVGQGRVLTALAEAAVEVTGDLLVAREGESQRPAGDRGRPGVADHDLGGEAAGPLAAAGVGHVASAATSTTGGADRPGEARRAGRAGAVPGGHGHRGRALCGGRAADQAA